MKPQLARLMDKWMGIPLCFVLTQVRNVSLLFPGHNRKNPFKKILLIKLSEKGAIVLAYHAIQRAIELVGKNNVYFLVLDCNSEILEVMDIISRENILEIRSEGIFQLLYNLLLTMLKIWKIGFDSVVDMEFFSRASTAIAFLSGATSRAGFYCMKWGPYRGNLITHKVNYNLYLHTSLLFYQLIDSLGKMKPENPFLKDKISEKDISTPKYIPASSEIERVKEIVLKNSQQSHISFPLIVMAPCVKDELPLRAWPIRHFIKLSNKIINNYPDVTIIMTGSQQEKDAHEEIARDLQSEKVIVLSGKITLRELLTLYTLSGILITNDSGPGHFASMTDINIVSLFGVDTPILWKPISPKVHAISANLICSPCMNVFNYRYSACKDNLCMQSISVGEVFDVVKEILEQKNFKNT